ncbi:DUF6088 family protein [Pseudomonas protegens]|uniref:DUF6088 family protein n=1 Tax=Pseudomonas protegens TaxID=380021 RepID=UPI0003699A89|nr:DUF6088 family protein [Pseudomonas protegens]ROM20498.1 hypothetical protein BK645_30035 [Pseudomonas protegens]ROM32487.1 hypothetical protein BK646_26150 [Pseudomonas protegens]
MPSLPAAILERIHALPEGSILAPKEFLHLGSRAAVDQAFSRLTKAGRLQRVARGVYVAPTHAGVKVEAVALSLAEKGKASIAGSGALAAKAFGLTSQIPEGEVFLTTGRSKELTIGQVRVSLQHAPYWMLALGNSKAGDAVRALAWMGPDHAQIAAIQLHERLPISQWEFLSSVRASLPSWMAAAIGKASIHCKLNSKVSGH